MKLIAYLRVSTVGQVKDGLGLPTQERQVRAWAKASGNGIVELIKDDGRSGTVDETARPGLLEALSALRRREAEGIVVSSIDRLARALTVQEAVLGKVWELGCEVFTTEGRVERDDPEDPMRTAMRQMAGVFAQLERALVVKRLRNGRATKAAQGGHAVGAPPYGWRAQDGELVQDEREQAILGRMRELRTSGLSYKAIADQLTEQDIGARRGRWWGTTVSRALRRPGS